MTWLLCRALCVCQLRRLASLARLSPVAAALTCVALAGAPVLLARLGAVLARELGPSLADAAVARALVVGPLLAAAAAGGVLGLSARGRGELGPQLAAAPVGAMAAVTASALAPLLLAAAAVLPGVAALALVVAAASPGGRPAGVALTLVPVVGVAAGALAVEAIAHAARGRLLAPLVVVPAAACWLAAGAWAGDVALGPVGLTALSLAGSQGAWQAVAGSAAAGAALAAAWAWLAAVRPPAARRRALRATAVVRGVGALAAGTAVLALLARRGETRIGIAFASLLGVAGVVLATASGAGAPAPLQLGVTSTLLGAALVPTATAGAVLRGRWLWAAAPTGRLTPPAPASLVAAAVVLAAVAPVVVLAAVVSGARGGALASVAAMLAGTVAVAVLAGVLVPCRGGGIGDQLATFAAFAACLAAASVLAGLSGPRLVAAGLPSPVAAALLVCCAWLAAHGAFVARVRRGG
ncbi:hypothetical protein [Gaiella occulta]|nr:hypothetical protein [Gaiella occulta]